MSFRQGSGNPFATSYSDQCTYWSQERYHQLTGIWTPCTGNAYQWPSQAANAGWRVTAQAPDNIPSIICLQAGAGQGLLSNFGHVAVVEKKNSDGSVLTSNYNWPIGTKNTRVTFHPSPGVTFIFADYNVGGISPIAKIQTIALTASKELPATFALSSNQNIADFLSNIDLSFTLINPFDVQTSTVSGSYDPNNYPSDDSQNISFTDPVAWLSGVGQNLWTDTVALVLRLVCLILGIYILWRVIDHFMNFSEAVQNISSRIGELSNA